MITSLVQTLSGLMTAHLWLAPLLAVAAGILTSISPCALTTVPLVIGYVGGTGQNSAARAFRYSFVFALGTATSFTVLGSAAAMLGKLMNLAGSVWYIVLGVVMVLMALQTFGILHIFPHMHHVPDGTARGYAGAFLTGAVGGIFASPCATPALVVLLGLVARGANVAWGVILLFLYSVGHSFLVVVAGTSVGFANRIIQSEKYERLSSILQYVLGAVMLLFAFYMFYLGF